MRDTTLDDVEALAQSMVNSPAAAVQLAGQLQATVQSLAVPRAELVTRPAFERAALWTYAVSFEQLDNSGDPSTKVIELQRDVHVRGVNACAIVQTPLENFELSSVFWLTSQAGGGKNLRWLFDVNWSIDDERGFITNGIAEIRARGVAITGDGEFSAPLDWRLQRNQTIVVRAASRLADASADAVEEPGTILRWLTVTFWCEELRQPGT